MNGKQCSFLMVILLPFTILSCYTPKRYTYTAKIAQGDSSSTVVYDNDSLVIRFRVAPKYIEMEIYNKMSEGIRVNWDQVTITKDGFLQKTIAYELGATKKKKLAPIPIIPPQSKIQLGLIANSKVRFRRLYGKRTLASKDTYPVTDKGHKSVKAFIQSINGTKVSIFLPYYLRDNYQSKNFELTLYVAEQQ